MVLNNLRTWCVLGGLLAVVAATLLVASTVTGSNSATDDSGTQDTARKTHDELMLGIADKIPDFAGMYLSSDGGTLYVNVLEGSESTLRKEDVKDAINETFKTDAATRGQVTLVPKKYTINQLHGWYVQALPVVLGEKGVVMTDLDEKDSRIRIWVTNDVDLEGLGSTLSLMGIPQKAVVFTPGSEIVLNTHKLTDAAPSSGLQGGFKIARSATTSCTLGYLVERSGTAGFITASHCTEGFGGVESTEFYQPTYSAAGDPVGTETIDPEFSYLNDDACPSGWECRYSDSAFIDLEPGVPYSRGKIAKPTNQGYTTVNHIEVFRVVRDTSLPTVGQEVHMIGKTSGWTSGDVSSTCANVSYGSSYKVLCQHVADYGSTSGDSGAPIFRVVDSPNTNDVHLSGIHWASASGGLSIYSPIDLIHTELGPTSTWRSCASGFSC